MKDIAVHNKAKSISYSLKKSCLPEKSLVPIKSTLAFPREINPICQLIVKK